MELLELKLLTLMSAIVISPAAVSETRFSLPRETNGIEVLLGIGASYDETAYTGEETLSEAGAALAIMTENFYVDVHEISYRKSLDRNLDIKLFGNSDGLPSDDDVEILSIKSGDSFDLGVEAEKDLGYMRVGALIAADVTGTHSGYKLELSTGKDVSSERSKFGFTVGGRYQDSKRSNYYFGVANDEVLSDVPEYNLDGNWTAFASALFGYQLTQNLGLFVGVDMESISSQIKDSPRIDSDASFGELEASITLAWQFSVYN